MVRAPPLVKRACTRGELLGAAAAVVIGHARIAHATLNDPATTRLLQAQLLDEHAMRFRHTSMPIGFQSLEYQGRTMRQLAAMTNIGPGVRVAVYPVEVVSDDDEFDDSYAVRLYEEDKVHGLRQTIDQLSGIPTSKSLSRAYIGGLPTIAMFANEPGMRTSPNCRFVFPTAHRAEIHVGDVLLGYLETNFNVHKGAALTWCYSPPEDERAYPTTCSAQSPRLLSLLGETV